MGHDHGHEHGHEHGQEHGHEGGHEHGGPGRSIPSSFCGPASLAERPDPGALLFFDAPSGLAGDMIVAALVDLGVPRDVVVSAVGCLGVSDTVLSFGAAERSGIAATTFAVEVCGPQPRRTYAGIRDLIGSSSLALGTKERALRTFARLAAAEARVHGIPPEDVHFHEVGAVDAIADVVGSSAALEYLGAKVLVSPLPMGRGFVNASHGVLPLPAPAALECLVGFATYDAGIEGEFVTPTGAAIIGAHAIGSSRWPPIVPQRIGWGAGSRRISDRPNVLRAILGTPSGDYDCGAGTTHAVIEANVDDMTGELAAHWIEVALRSGAVDAWASPITMKKGRPALTLSALAPIAMSSELSHMMLRETTSLGVRVREVSRFERPRTVVIVNTPFGDIPVKVSEGPFGPPGAKPEFDVCAAVARAHGVPVGEVLRVAMAAWASSK